MKTRSPKLSLPTLSAEDKTARKLVVQSIANDLFSLRDGVDRSVYYGVFGEEKRKMMNLYPWLTNGVLHYQISKLELQKKNKLELQKKNADLTELQEKLNNGHGGRPEGTTEEALKTLSFRKRKAVDDAAQMFSAKKQKGKLRKGELAAIISSAISSNGLQDETTFDISLKTIRSRERNKTATGIGSRFGATSPLVEIEPLVVEFCIERARMGQPFSQGEGIAFINSIIDGTTHQTKLVTYQTKHIKMRKSSPNVGTVGRSYWRGFLKRNKNLLDSGSPNLQAISRKEWSSYLNFERMYDLVYNQMEHAGVLEKLESPQWMDIDGNIVMEEAEALGKKVEHRLKHPEYVLFVDEVGNNTNMKEDGRVGGERLLKAKGTKASISASTTDAHYTVLGFTAATGEAVMCAIIFAGSYTTQKLQLGTDIQAPLVDGEESVRGNYGAGKRYPGGPSCSFRGKIVPPFICCSPKGGITSELLKQMLQRMDELELFPRTLGGPIPFIQLDGHGSRLQLPFLRYILTPATEWRACIGVPNGTAAWQVGDSSEQNGSWKMASTSFKRKLCIFKVSMGISMTVAPTDIIPIVNHAWDRSFAKIDTNKKAIAERGWGPLNRALLMDKDILKTRVELEKTEVATATIKQILTPSPSGPPTTIEVVIDGSTVVSDLTAATPLPNTINPATLNLSYGFSGKILTDVMQYAMKNEKTTANLAKRYEEGKTLRDSLLSQSNKRLTAGSLFRSNRVALDSEVLEYLEEKEAESVRKNKNNLIKANKEFDTYQSAALLAMSNKKSPDKMSVKDLKAIVRYKKRKGDAAIPATKLLLLERYEASVGREDQTRAQFIADRVVEGVQECAVEVGIL